MICFRCADCGNGLCDCFMSLALLWYNFLCSLVPAYSVHQHRLQVGSIQWNLLHVQIAERCEVCLFGWFYWISIDTGCRRQIGKYTRFFAFCWRRCCCWIKSHFINRTRVRERERKKNKWNFSALVSRSYHIRMWQCDSTTREIISHHSIVDDYEWILIFLRKQSEKIVKCVFMHKNWLLRANERDCEQKWIWENPISRRFSTLIKID